MNNVKLINECNNISDMNSKLSDLENESRNEEAVMYIVVNNDLKMEKGKIAGQCCHSACRVTRILENVGNNVNSKKVYNRWIKYFEPKIILRASQKELEDLIKNYSVSVDDDIKNDIWCVYTRDIGRTQIEKGSLTTVAFCPILRKNVPDSIKNLRLA